MRPLRITAYTLTNALGRGNAASLEALRAGRSGLTPCDFEGAELETWIGRVEGLEDLPVTGRLSAYDCRNNRLAQLALAQDGFEEACLQARSRYGADGIGVFMGTSTSGIEQTERAYRARHGADQPLPDWFDYQHTHNVFSLASYVRDALLLEGPAQCISTACSSSAKVFATAWRHMQAGLCEAAIVGGVDSLCLMTLYGFNSLQLVSGQPCRPADPERDGINIGEAGGFALIEWADETDDCLCVLGYGESADAYHMSSPHPEGLGAADAMRAALTRAGLNANTIDYVNLHGTATQANDAAEDRAVTAVLGTQTPCSSTKGWTGHTLGAAGITEVGFGCLSIEHGFIPGSINTQNVDPAFQSNVVLENRDTEVSYVMTNSFGFGGSNASLILGCRQ
ncbi:MAG: beta-ketoacyl-[acyl-carrier-protein] synthase family protein [Gammaproteobacteria bacterium]